MKTHEVLFRTGFAPAEWQTKCGWKFALSNYKETDTIPKESKLICGSCLQRRKQGIGAGG